ncbi:hypothetical protein [Pseudomonas sp. DP-17]|uniref:hypothetical protein n=1 Tax=Pseudomonas sp. DP-17 TaxID=1580486 RepID=UPI001EFA7250|nr:hypothetical protein [Pseudomonas sp. DP-17]MCG8911275.1 hypothetical protein [Pseudomonas sp. DP-17]
MSDVTRQELDAKLEAIEARLDTRLASISGKIDAFLAVQAERDKALEQRDERLLERVNSSITLSNEWNQKFRLIAERSVEAALSADESAKQAATLKTHFWASVAAQLLAVAAIVVGAYFANQASVLGIASSTLSAYQAGKADSQHAVQQDPKGDTPNAAKQQ